MMAKTMLPNDSGLFYVLRLLKCFLLFGWVQSGIIWLEITDIDTLSSVKSTNRVLSALVITGLPSRSFMLNFSTIKLL